jgi:hypothetical protein
MAGDRATGTNALEPLYENMSDKPVRVDLDALWLQLGIQSSGASVRFDDSAKLAAIRRAITLGESTSSEKQSLFPKPAAVFAGRTSGTRSWIWRGAPQAPR